MDPRPTPGAHRAPDFPTLDERDRPSLTEVVVIAAILLVLAAGDYVVFRDQLSGATGDDPLNAALLTIAMVLGVQVLMHLAAIVGCLRRAGLRRTGPGWEVAAVLAWLGLCAAMVGLRWVVPLEGTTAHGAGQQVVGVPVPEAALDPAAGLLNERFAWLCLALALVSGFAAYLATTVLYRPRARLRRRAEADLAVLEQEETAASAQLAAAEAAVAALEAAVEREDDVRDARRARLCALAEEAAELARLELVAVLGDPTDTTRITRAASLEVATEAA